MGRPIFQGFVIVSVAIVAALVYSWRDMKLKTARSVALLKQDATRETLSTERLQEILEELPPVVQTYYSKALPKITTDPSAIRHVRTLTIQQKGTFRMKDEWIPFTAQQDFSANVKNLGFVWDATMFLPEPLPTFLSFGGMQLPVTVVDAYVQGKGLLEARLFGVVPVAHAENNPEIDSGELLRYLAESFLFPTVLLPTEQGEVTWSSVEDDPNKAMLTIHDRHSKTKETLTVQFDKDGLPSRITGLRPKIVDNKVSNEQWEGQFLDFQLIGGMLVPTRMDGGWWEGNTLELYFKGENIDFQYGFF